MTVVAVTLQLDLKIRNFLIIELKYHTKIKSAVDFLMVSVVYCLRFLYFVVL